MFPAIFISSSVIESGGESRNAVGVDRNQKPINPFDKHLVTTFCTFSRESNSMAKNKPALRIVLI